MWRVVLGLGVLLQAGGVRADEAAPTAAKPEQCPAGQSCDVDEPAVPAEAPAAKAAATPADAPPVPAAVSTVPANVANVAHAGPAAHEALATVSFRNDVGTKLRLVEARFTVDAGDRESVIVSPEPGRSYVIVNGPLTPGPHVVTTHLVYQGDRRVFTYMNGYRINVAADKIVTAPADGAVSFTIVGAENRGMTVPLEKRLVVKVEQGVPAIRK